jgi:hypothetical protein
LGKHQAKQYLKINPLNAMKSFILIFSIILIGIEVLEQSPQTFNYQAVARDLSGNVLANKNLNFKISILKASNTGTVVYSEIQSGTTNSFGLVNLEIGKGNSPSGSFAEINWGAGIYFLKVDMDPAGGTAYQPMGISQLSSVPYALNAKTAENGFSGNYNDLSNKPTGNTIGDMLYWNGAK